MKFLKYGSIRTKNLEIIGKDDTNNAENVELADEFQSKENNEKGLNSCSLKNTSQKPKYNLQITVIVKTSKIKLHAILSST